MYCPFEGFQGTHIIGSNKSLHIVRLIKMVSIAPLWRIKTPNLLNGSHEPRLLIED